MSQYLGSTDYNHAAPERVGVLLVNLGTPDAPTTTAVRRYLKQFLSDPRVVEYPRWLWWLVLNGVILRVRPSRSAHAYRQIWTEQGSPLLVLSQRLTDKLQTALHRQVDSQIEVALGMTYGEPSIDSALQRLHAQNVRKLVVLPLYPQYSGSTTGSVFDSVTSVLKKWRWLPEIHFITQYHDCEPYVSALADSVQRHWQTQERSHLLLSFHGLPKRYLLAGDPYHCQCLKTARLIAERLALKPDEWSVSFQSQVGREEWLKPYTDELLLQYAGQGPKRLTVICPGFAVDCLETLEEIALRNRQAFLDAGGERYDYVPALNDDDRHVQALLPLIVPPVRNWLPIQDRRRTQELATQMGAQC